MMMILWMGWWTPPESVKTSFAVRLLIGIILLEVLIRDMGPVNVLLVPSHAQKHVPAHWLRGRWPEGGCQDGGLTHSVVTLLRQRASGVRRE